MAKSHVHTIARGKRGVVIGGPQEDDGHVAVGEGNGDVKPAAAWDFQKTSLAVPACQMPAFQRKEGS